MKQMALPFRKGGPEPLLLIDGMNLLFRSHYAFPYLSDEEGRPTGAIYGFLNAMFRLRKFSSDQIVCWEGTSRRGGVANWRDKIYREYKEGRHSPDRERVLSQLPAVQTGISLLNARQLQVPGLEGDDLLGILSAGENRVFIVSNDADFYQLLEGDRVQILQATKKGYKPLTQAMVEKEHGIPVALWPYYLSLGGDSSDNVHPLPRYGKVKAMRMVQEGAVPFRPFEMQSAKFRQSYAKLESLWPRVQKAFDVVLIPRRDSDRRLPKGSRKLLKVPPVPILSREWRLDQFSRFCAEYNMLDFLGQRREFIR